MSENYFQHADHFSRILSEQENYKKSKFNEKNSSESTQVENIDNNKDTAVKNKDENSNKIQTEAN